MNTNSGEVAVYARRWFILIGTCIISLASTYISKSFTIANNIYAHYFDVSLAWLDWLCLGLSAGTVVITPVFAWFSFNKSVRFKLLSITGIACLLFSCIILVATVIFPYLFPLLVVSNLLQGMANCVSLTVGPFFAVMWFPNNQVGLAIAFNVASRSLGSLFGAILPSITLLDYPFFNNSANHTMQQNFVEAWKNNTYYSLLYIYTPWVLTLAVLLVVFILFVKNLPPKPPSFGLLLKQNEDSSLYYALSFRNFIETTKILFQDRTFLLCSIVVGIFYNLSTIELLYLTDILSTIIKKLSNNYSADVLAGEITLAYSLTSISSVFLSAKLLNCWKNYIGQTYLGSVVTFFSVFGLLLSYCYNSIIGFWLCNCAFGVGNRLCVLPLLEMILDHTYPMDEAFVSVWLSGIGSAVFVALAELARLTSRFTLPVSALVLMTAAVLFAFLLTVALDPKDRRSQLEQRPTTDYNERSPLVSKQK